MDDHKNLQQMFCNRKSHLKKQTCKMFASRIPAGANRSDWLQSLIILRYHMLFESRCANVWSEECNINLDSLYLPAKTCSLNPLKAAIKNIMLLIDEQPLSEQLTLN